MNNEGVVGSTSSFKLQAVYFDFFVLIFYKNTDNYFFKRSTFFLPHLNARSVKCEVHMLVLVSWYI